MKTTDEQKLKFKEYYLKNKELLNKKSKLYYINNKEKSLEDKKKYVIENPDKIKIQQRNWYLKNREKKIKKSNEYIKNNKVKHQLYNSNRRAAKKNTNDNSININSINKILLNQNYKCIYCLKDIKLNFHIDHIVPLSKCGGHTINNIQLLCDKCNLRKNNKSHNEFIKYLSITK